MSLDFQVEKRKNNFVILTGLPIQTFTNDYPAESTFLSAFREGDEFIVPRHQLCNVLDRCFDHFNEESLIHITKLLDKNDDELRDRIQEQSVSKRKQSKKDSRLFERPIPQVDSRHVPQVAQQVAPPFAPPVENRPFQQVAPSVENRSFERQSDVRPRHDGRQDRHEQRKFYESEPRYDELRYEPRTEVSKTKSELLKMFYTMKTQMDNMERYLLSMK
jgi:hypothetical protein